MIKQIRLILFCLIIWGCNNSEKTKETNINLEKENKASIYYENLISNRLRNYEIPIDYTGDNTKDYTFCFENIVEQDETGRTVYKFKFNYFEDGSVEGLFGYYPEYDIDLHWWDGNVEGTIENGIIKGLFTYTSEEKKFIEPFEFIIMTDEEAIYNRANFIYIDQIKEELEPEQLIFKHVNCTEINKG